MACIGIHNFSCAEHLQGSVEHHTVITISTYMSETLCIIYGKCFQGSKADDLALTYHDAPHRDQSCYPCSSCRGYPCAEAGRKPHILAVAPRTFTGKALTGNPLPGEIRSHALTLGLVVGCSVP